MRAVVFDLEDKAAPRSAKCAAVTRRDAADRGEHRYRPRAPVSRWVLTQIKATIPIYVLF
jgi:hypothetical protein